MKAFRFVIALLLLLCTVPPLQAQNRRTVGDMMGVVVNGCVYGSDELESKPYGLPNASIHMTCLNDTSVTLDILSTKNGQFSKYMYVLRKRVKKNDAVRVRIKVSYLGYETFEKDYSAVYTYYDEDNPSLGRYWKLQVDSIMLQSQPVTIQEAEIVGELQRMYESGDTTVFNVEAYQRFFRRLLGLRLHRNIARKEVIMYEVDPSHVLPLLEQFRADCAAYVEARHLWRMPSYLRTFFRYEPDSTVIDLSERLEMLVDELANSRDSRVIGTLNAMPILVPDAHTRPFRRPRLNMLMGILFPVGIILWVRIWRYRLRLWRDMDQLQKHCDYISTRLKKLSS